VIRIYKHWLTAWTIQIAGVAWHFWLSQIQPPVLSGMGNESVVADQCGDAVWLRSTAKYGPYYLWIRRMRGWCVVTCPV